MAEEEVEAAASASGLTDEHWDDLLRSIAEEECTPVIGAGACAPTLPLAHEIAEDLVARYGYPLTDTTNLARVTQYLAIRRFPMFPKREVLARINDAEYPDFEQPDDPHGVLAGLPIPIYITTNYDDFLEEALSREMRDVQWDHCAWNGYHEVAGTQSLLETTYVPNQKRPLVYHLHGHRDIQQSIVLTEQDYLSFLLKASSEGANLLPPRIRIALANNALLFIGYSMTDWTFRVLFKSLVEMIKANSQLPAVSIQVSPSDVKPGQEDDARAYLEEYHRRLQGIDVRMYWGTARQFARELRDRWAAYK